MSESALILSGLIIATITVQAILVLGFARTLRRKSPELISNDAAPRAAVILCLRGGDPFLAECLRGLINQDYPDYDIRIVVDHPNDPARQIVAEVLEQNTSARVQMEFLQEPRPTCSLKCSSILQVVESLDDSYHFIAQLDADTVAHPTWLRELATALADEKVGAATGNRWYMPASYGLGSMVRYGWNAAAIVQMYWYQIAWGGTLAVKMQLFKETNLLEKWGNAFCEDTMLHAALKKAGQRVAFVPSLMMINREECTLSGFFPWVCRQLMTARLYHPAWLGVVGHGVITTLLPVFALGTFVHALATNEITSAIGIAVAFLVYELSLIVLLWPLENSIRKIAQRRGEPTNWLSTLGFLKFLVVMPVTQVVYAVALVSSVAAKSTSWRGIEYQVDGPWQIQMLKYQPFEQTESQDQKSSL